MTALRPLPRSLVPLPQESLAGFFLRLSHRLDIAPSDLFFRTGLSPREGYPVTSARHLLSLEPLPLSRLARTAKLGEDQVERLTLRPLLERYLPLAGAPVRAGQERTRWVFPQWVLAGPTNCCPSCLTGDSSEIQRRHGGAWSLLWHLPVVFACPRHQVFLRETCPGCRQPIHGGFPDGPRQLVPAAASSGLHPAQCRNHPGPHRRELCSLRLDHHEHYPAQPPLTAETADLQNRLLALLDPAAAPSDAFSTFSDLRAVAAVVLAAWPNSAEPDMPPGLDLALDNFLIAREQLMNPKERARGYSNRAAFSFSAAPTPPPATAALLHLADRCLQLEPDAFRARLADLLAHIPDRRHPRWGKAWRGQLATCSAMVRSEATHALDRRLPARTSWSDLLDSRSPLVLGRRGYRAENIPQEIPTAWLDVLLGRDRAAYAQTIRTLRRLTAIRLVQAAETSTMREAARFLGIPSAWFVDPAKRVLPFDRLPQLRDGQDLAQALERLAQHVENDPHPIDYHERRRRLATWHLQAASWETIKQESDFVPRRRGKYPVTDELLRDCASAVVWARATGSEWRLAPAMQFPLSPLGRPDPTGPEHRVINSLTTRAPTGRYRQLIKTLAAHADTLAQAPENPWRHTQ
ncbi:TniQ family protein [Kitasatospora sp. NPDC096077]|uniref:TniQ family protein n=1 Tax=Kitasatospora sp. NPDC096077 TaxID=3155544 RepID=UPI003327B799